MYVDIMTPKAKKVKASMTLEQFYAAIKTEHPELVGVFDGCQVGEVKELKGRIFKLVEKPTKGSI